MAFSIDRSRRLSRRALLGPAVLTAGLLAGALVPHAAHAAMSVSADPVVQFSNGINVKLTATMTTANPSDITHVSYTLHAPAGVSVVKVVFTNATSANAPTNGTPTNGVYSDGAEDVTVYTDAATATYQAATTVTSPVATLGVSVQQRNMSMQSSAAVTCTGVANTPIATQLTFVG